MNTFKLVSSFEGEPDIYTYKFKGTVIGLEDDAELDSYDAILNIYHHESFGNELGIKEDSTIDLDIKKYKNVEIFIDFCTIPDAVLTESVRFSKFLNNIRFSTRLGEDYIGIDSSAIYNEKGEKIVEHNNISAPIVYKKDLFRASIRIEIISNELLEILG